jgi:hypothetical protein
VSPVAATVLQGSGGDPPFAVPPTLSFVPLISHGPLLSTAPDTLPDASRINQMRVWSPPSTQNSAFDKGGTGSGLPISKSNTGNGPTASTSNLPSSTPTLSWASPPRDRSLHHNVHWIISTRPYGRLSLENLIALGQRDPGLLAAGPDVPSRPQPGCIVQSARTHAAHAIRPRHAANPAATLRANQSGVYAPTIGGAF